MKYTEIIKLLDAGYSREEILQMQEEQPEKKTEEQPEKKTEEQPNDSQAEVLGELKELFADMKKEFTAMNIMNSRREDEEKTGDEIIANIINPFTKKEK